MRHVLVLSLTALVASAGEDGEAARAKEIAARLASDEADAVLAALRDAGECQEASLTSPLVRLLKDHNPAVRGAAVEALGLRKEPLERKRAAKALAARIAPLAKKKDEDKAELLKIVETLHDLAEPAALEPLLDDIGIDDDREVAIARMHAAANIPCREIIDDLLRLASAGRRGGGNWRREAALKALRYATQEDVKGGVDEWRRWWSDNKATYSPDIAANKRADARLEEKSRQEKREARRKKKKPE
jgi:HEAT repeats